MRGADLRLEIPSHPADLAGNWRATAAAFLIEKAHRSGSRRTVEVYGHMLAAFFRVTGDPSRATALDVFRFAYGLGTSGRPPSASTVAVRLAAVSGLFDFGVRMGLLSANPARDVHRPVPRPPEPRGLSVDEVRGLLRAIPGTPRGRLDRAVVLTALLTGLRRSELVNLRLSRATAGVLYEVRTKGGATRRRDLPGPAILAIADAAQAAGRVVDWQRPFPISGMTFYRRLRLHGTRAGIGPVSPHVLRHTAAKLRREAGGTIEDVAGLLGHASLATTARYLMRLEPESDRGWYGVAQHIGVLGDSGIQSPSVTSAAGSGSTDETAEDTDRGPGFATGRTADARRTRHRSGAWK